jgi:hypothetical protein
MDGIERQDVAVPQPFDQRRLGLRVHSVNNAGRRRL